MKQLSAAILAVLLFACGEPKIDASSEESFLRSLQAMQKPMSEDRKEELDRAFQDLLLFSEQDISSPGFRAIFADKTAKEILEAAEAIRQQRQRERRAQALQEIAELEEKQRSAEVSREALSSFRVERSRLKKVSQRFGGPEPRIELSVANGTDFAISRAYFRGVVASPGRTIPWIQKEFNYVIPGGLEPGESAAWTLLPNQFSEWGTVDYPGDAVLTVEVLRLDGADGETLFDASGLSESEVKRLDDLRREFAPERGLDDLRREFAPERGGATEPGG